MPLLISIRFPAYYLLVKRHLMVLNVSILVTTSHQLYLHLLLFVRNESLYFHIFGNYFLSTAAERSTRVIAEVTALGENLVLNEYFCSIALRSPDINHCGIWDSWVLEQEIKSILLTSL